MSNTRQEGKGKALKQTLETAIHSRKSTWPHDTLSELQGLVDQNMESGRTISAGTSFIA